jgi:hypothetical protein
MKEVVEPKYSDFRFVALSRATLMRVYDIAERYGSGRGGELEG